MKFFNLVMLCALLTTSSFTFGKTVAGVELEEKLTIEEQVLTLNGAGIRSKFIMDLYVGSLYLSDSYNYANEVINANTPMMVQLDITSGMITSERMIDAIEEGFDNATKDNAKSIREEITPFIAVFNEPIKVGDKFNLLFVPERGLIVIKNNEVINTQAISFKFKKALFAIWLGDKPAQNSLKKAMLSH